MMTVGEQALRQTDRARRQAWPASEYSIAGSIPSRAESAVPLGLRNPGSNKISGSAGAVSQPFAWISVFKLARCPSGIAEREDRVFRSVALRKRPQNFESRRQADPVVDRQRGLVEHEIIAVKDEATRSTSTGPPLCTFMSRTRVRQADRRLSSFKISN